MTKSSVPPWFQGTTAQFAAIAVIVRGSPSLATYFRDRTSAQPAGDDVDAIIDALQKEMLDIGYDGRELNAEGVRIDDLVDTIAHLKPEWSD